MGFAHFDGLGDERVGRALVVVGGLDIELQNRRDIAAINKFEEADEFAFVIGAEEIAVIGERAVVVADFVKGFSVVAIEPALANGGFILDGADTLNDVALETAHFDNNAAPLSPLDVLAGVGGDFLPPVVESGDASDGHATHFDWIVVTGNSGWDLLREAEDVGARSGLRLFEIANAVLRIIDFRLDPLFIVKGGDADAFAGGDEVLVVDAEKRDADPLSANTDGNGAGDDFRALFRGDDGRRLHTGSDGGLLFADEG